MKTCQACGVVIERTHGRAIYCEPCASEGRRQRNRRRGNLGRVAAPYARSQRVLSPKAMTVGETNAGRELYPEMPGVDYQRPRTRAECKDGPRPCPYVSCRHHLFLDVKESGAIVFNFWGKEPDEMAESCSLDVADRGGLELTEVAAALGLTREAARVIELRAAAKVRAAKPWLRADVEGDRVRLVVLPTDDDDTDTDDMPEAAE